MQGPGGWVWLGFVLNWKWLSSGVEAKPCIGHWDSCALPGGEWGVSAWDLDRQPQSRELLAARVPWAWAGREWGAGEGCALHPPANPQTSLGSWTLSQRLAKNTRFLGKKAFRAFFPCLPCSLICSCVSDIHGAERETQRAQIRMVWGASSASGKSWIIVRAPESYYFVSNRLWKSIWTEHALSFLRCSITRYS